MKDGNWTAEEIRNEVKQLVSKVTELNAEEISDTALFIEELGIDSLMAIEILVSMDKKYKIQISDEEFTKVKNVNDAVELVQRSLENRPALQ
ncbi:MAG: hypothetical protein A3F68_09935 [Acidobacteria bacterium RIFCSPLOWO2_12_FULL_54_10]|nr:MAG: hypothetical protein A3F68_09935 [Acidobacteria bacterium RIFCSPLOWO2_12_FULL_54_10]